MLRPRRIIWTIAAAVLLITGMALGIAAQRSGVPGRVRAQASEAWSTVAGRWVRPPEPDVRPLSRRRLRTNLFDLDEAALAVGPAVGASIAALEQVGDGLLFLELSGRLGYLSFHGGVRDLGVRAPMNLEGLHDWVERSQQPFFLDRFRALDAAIATGASGTRQLYVSHHRFTSDGVQFVVSAIDLREDADGPVLHGGWREVFVATPTVPLPPRAPTFSGHESGGRMLPIGPRHLLVTIGHFGFEGVYMTPPVSMDPSVHLGKIVDLDVDSGEARLVSSGHRNPQGLALDAQGRVWSTEHGPYGGDELNLIVEGRNYGWPLTTFGLNYGLPRADWPTNAKQGRHDAAFELPVFAFSPSPGLSNLVEIDGDEFPLWRGDLLLGSMVGQSLFRVRLDDGRVRSVETIRMADRIRDLLRLDDGRIALSTDSGRIVILQRERTEGEPSPALPPAVSGFAALERARLEAAAGRPSLPEADIGQRLFGTHCATCHAVDGSPSSGPSLRGVVGRPIAAVPGYAYSDALARAEGSWTPARLYDYLVDPQNTFPGTTMPGVPIHNRNIDEVIDFLRAASPAP